MKLPGVWEIYCRFLKLLLDSWQYTLFWKTLKLRKWYLIWLFWLYFVWKIVNLKHWERKSWQPLRIFLFFLQMIVVSNKLDSKSDRNIPFHLYMKQKPWKIPKFQPFVSPLTENSWTILKSNAIKPEIALIFVFFISQINLPPNYFLLLKAILFIIHLDKIA